MTVEYNNFESFEIEQSILFLFYYHLNSFEVGRSNCENLKIEGQRFCFALRCSSIIIHINQISCSMPLASLYENDRSS